MGLNLDKVVFFRNNENIINKRVVLFGTGLVCKKFINNFDKSKILYLVDNNEKLWGTKFEGLIVHNPKKLEKLNSKNILVIIMTTSFSDVISQIESLNKNLKIKVSNYLKDIICIEYLQNLEKKILISSGLPARKEKNIGGGLYELNITRNSWSIKKVYSGIVHGIIRYKNGFAISDSANGIILLDKNYKIMQKGKYPLNTRAHGISYDFKKNFFYVACSLTDQIKVFDHNLKLKDKILISEKFKKLNLPQHHINDLYLKDGYLYVSMFSLSGNHRHNIYDGGVYEINLSNKKITNQIYGNLKMPHSIKYFNDSFSILDSMRGELIIGKDCVATFSGFSRGMDYNNEYYYIGQSRNRNFSMISSTKDNVSIDNGIIIYDIKNKISRKIVLPFTVSEIHEVLVIS